MQSDTFLPDTDSDDDEAYSSDSSGDLPKNNNIGVKYDPIVNDGRFLDQSTHSQYEKVNRELFNPQLRKGRIVYFSHHSDDSTFKNNIDLVDAYKLNGLDNVIGFEFISAHIVNSHSSHQPFIDLHIPEIPHIACKQNEYGVPIIARIKTAVGSDTTNYTLNEHFGSYHNYFTPIKLSSLTIKLFKYDGSVITSTEPKIIFEFEITILNDTLSKR